MENRAKFGFLLMGLFFVAADMVAMDGASFVFSFDGDEVPVALRRVEDGFTKEFNTIPQLQINGKISIADNSFVGFCDKNSIKYFNDIGIQTNQATPVLAINKILIKNPKKNPSKEDSYSNWVDSVPVVVQEHVSNYLNAVKRKHTSGLLSDSQVNRFSSSIFNTSGIDAAYYKALEKATRYVLLAALPITMFLKPTIYLKNLFGFCNVSLTCDCKDLFGKIDSFNQHSHTIIPLGLSTIKEVQRFEVLEEGHCLYERIKSFADAAMELALTRSYTSANDLSSQLVESNVLGIQRQKDSADSLPAEDAEKRDFMLIEDRERRAFVFYTHREPGKNFPNVREMAIQENFPKKSVFKYLQNRELGYNR